MIRQDSASTESCFECGAQAAHWHHVIPTCLGGHKRLPLCEAQRALFRWLLFGNTTECLSPRLSRCF